MARVCSHCGDLLPLHRLKKLHCSIECAKESQYIRNRNEYSVGSIGWRDGLLKKDGMPEMYVDPDILAQAELYADCAEEDNNGFTAFIQEDVEDLHMILRSEYALAEAKYEKRPKARYSGKNYWEAKVLRNYHRKKAGAPALKSIRYHNFERKLEKWHQENRGEIPKQETPTEAQIETPAFATISPAKTKSGKLFSEILDAVQRKKAAC
jgi:hypothetical protein